MDSIEFAFTGDLVLDEPDPDHWLSGIAPVLRAADLTIGHVEVPHTRSRVEVGGDIPAPGADPANLDAVARAGFKAVSLAGNHIADCGTPGIADTLDKLQQLGMAHAGAGANIAAARAPAIVTLRGKRVGLLSYNCVGPEHAWATEERGGCAYVRVSTADGSPVAPAAPLRDIDPDSAASMRSDIQKLRAHVDVLIVAFHKGIVHTRAQLARYERAVSHAAIDAGCDIVVGHHAHIVRGIELYRGRPIFHGLGNGCVVTRALTADQSHPKRAEWARRRRELFGFDPDPAYTLAPFHPEAVNAMIGRVRWTAQGMQTGFIPVHVEAPGRPVLANEEQRIRIAKYVDAITREAELPELQLRIARDGVWLT